MLNAISLSETIHPLKLLSTTCALACRAYIHALSCENLKSSFKKSGIFPFDPSAVDSFQFAPATVFQTECSTEIESHLCSEKKVETQNDTSEHNNVEFFKLKTECLKKKANEQQKSRRNVSDIVSGKPLTEDKTVQNLQAYQSSGSKRKLSDKNVMISEKSVCSKKIKRDGSKNKTKQIKTRKPEPQPGPSGIQTHIVSASDSDSNYEDENERCCVCNLIEPKQLKDCVSLVFVKWAKCDVDNCSHWTHVKFCCKENVIHLGDKFVCPCH